MSDSMSEECQARLSEMLCYQSPADGHECQKHFYPVRELLDLIGDKWSVLIVLCLGEQEALRFSELMQKVAGISKRMLSLKLQNLERDGLISRSVQSHYPPRVCYALTEMGGSLLLPIKGLARWAVAHYPQVEAARGLYFERQQHEARAPWQQEKPVEQR